MVTRNPKGLGRGLSALIPEEAFTETSKEQTPHMMSVDKIKRNEKQPRTEFEKESLAELSESIKNFGVLQPLLIMPEGDYYKVVAGERRLRAAVMAGLKEVPVVVKEFDDKSLLQAALIENLQREDLSEVECAKAYRSLAEDFGLTQEEIADSVGKSRTSVTNTMRLLSLPEKVLKLIEEKKLTAGHARAVLSVEGDEKRIEFAKFIAEKGLSVREAEKMSKIFGVPSKKQEKPKVKPAYILGFEEQLSQSMGTKVQIENKGKGGFVRIDYYNNDDLERIISILNS